jgi:hypothetical protein
MSKRVVSVVLDEEVLVEFKRKVLKVHGTLYDKMNVEATNAFKNWIPHIGE